MSTPLLILYQSSSLCEQRSLREAFQMEFRHGCHSNAQCTMHNPYPTFELASRRAVTTFRLQSICYFLIRRVLESEHARHPHSPEGTLCVPTSSRKVFVAFTANPTPDQILKYASRTPNLLPVLSVESMNRTPSWNGTLHDRRLFRDNVRMRSKQCPQCSCFS